MQSRVDIIVWRSEPVSAVAELGSFERSLPASFNALLGGSGCGTLACDADKCSAQHAYLT